MFEVDAMTSSPRADGAEGVDANVTLSWSKGGFQGGRGWQVDGGTGAISPTPSLYVENVREELDEADEWFYDDDTRSLYVCWNGTGAPPPDVQFVATNLPRLVEVVGTSAAPVRDVRIAGVGLRDTSYTYMDPWGVPSGGDWSLHRGAAVFLEGTENVTVERNFFRRLDGNALLFSGYNRDGVVDGNEFAWIGDTAWRRGVAAERAVPPRRTFGGRGGFEGFRRGAPTRRRHGRRAAATHQRDQQLRARARHLRAAVGDVVPGEIGAELHRGQPLLQRAALRHQL